MKNKIILICLSGVIIFGLPLSHAKKNKQFFNMETTVNKNIVAGALTALAHIEKVTFLADSSFTAAPATSPVQTDNTATPKVAFVVSDSHQWTPCNLHYSPTKANRGGWICLNALPPAKEEKHISFNTDYYKGNIASLLAFAHNIPCYALLIQLKRLTPTGVIRNYKKELRENKFCVSYPTALKNIKYLSALGYVMVKGKDLILISYDEITTLSGGTPKHSNFYVDASENIKVYLEGLILKASSNKQSYKILEATEKAQTVNVTKLSSQGLVVCNQRVEDDVFLTCQGYANKIVRKSKLTGHRHFRKLERAGLLTRTPRFIKHEIGSTLKCRYLFGELYHIIPYALDVRVEFDCRKKLKQEQEPQYFYCGELD